MIGAVQITFAVRGTARPGQISYKNKTCQDFKVYCDIQSNIYEARQQKIHEGITIAVSNQLVNNNKGFTINITLVEIIFTYDVICLKP